MTTRWALLVINDEIVGDDGHVVRSRGLRGRRLALGLEHAHDLGGACLRLPEAYVAAIVGAPLARQMVVGLAALGETRAADAAWPAMRRGELTGVSARLADAVQQQGVVVRADIAEVSIVLSPACPSTRVVALEEGRMAHETIVAGLTNWARGRAAQGRAVPARAEIDQEEERRLALRWRLQLGGGR